MITTAHTRELTGFGCDPIFESRLGGAGQTFAEMDRERKKSHGHRSRAFTLLEPQLHQLLAGDLIHTPETAIPCRAEE